MTARAAVARICFAGGVLSLAATAPSLATANCRQALAIGMDVSGSVNAEEYTLQVNGLALALTNAEVQQALFAMPGAPVRLFVYEWAGLDHQRTILDWTDISNPTVLQEIAETIAATKSQPGDIATALGLSIEYGARQLAQQSECWALTLDISGDGKSNAGPRPRDVIPKLRTGKMTINALVVGADAPADSDRRNVQIAELSAYFLSEVIVGPSAFVETALGYPDYEAAMTRKLLRELKVFAIGQILPEAHNDVPPAPPLAKAR